MVPWQQRTSGDLLEEYYSTMALELLTLRAQFTAGQTDHGSGERLTALERLFADDMPEDDDPWIDEDDPEVEKSSDSGWKDVAFG